jgi:hypothetical protein
MDGDVQEVSPLDAAWQTLQEWRGLREGHTLRAALSSTSPCSRRLTAPLNWFRSGGHASRVRQNTALTSFVAWFGGAKRAAEPGCCTCRGGRQACGLPSPAKVSAALGALASHCSQYGSVV